MRVALAEDGTLFREGLLMLLCAEIGRAHV